MKYKILTLFVVFIVLSAVLLSCISIPLSSDDDQNSTLDKSDNTSSELSTDEESNDKSNDESIDNSDDQSTENNSKDNSNSSENESEPPVTDVIKQSTDWSGKDAAQLDSYFNDSVIVGDSVMLGFKSYVGKKRLTNEKFLGELKFHVGGSYGVHNALLSVSSKSVHPLFAGEQTTVEDAVQKMNAKRVYILFGLNDVGLYSNGKGAEETFKNYKTLLSRIKEKSPNVEIVILSATYLYEPWDKTMVRLTSANLRKLNQLMLEYCNENGMDFIDVATELSDKSGFLKEEFCSDKQCHLTEKAYNSWVDILRAYAAQKNDGKYKNVSSMTSMYK